MIRGSVSSTGTRWDLARCGALIGGFLITNYPLFCQRAGVDPFTETVGPEVLAAAISVSYATIMVVSW